MESLRKIIESRNTNDEIFSLALIKFPALISCHILSLNLEIYVCTLLNAGTVEGKEQSIPKYPGVTKSSNGNLTSVTVV